MNEGLRVTVKYSCKLCGLYRVLLPVTAREQEDVRVWMDSTVRQVQKDHLRRSPQCEARELTELMIPMTGTDRVGGPVQQ